MLVSTDHYFSTIEVRRKDNLNVQSLLISKIIPAVSPNPNIGGNVTIYGVQPSENDQVTFEAWIDSGQVALFDAEPDTEVDDASGTTSTNGVKALKTIVMDPSEHQLYLRITNPTEDFFFFAGVE